MKRPVKSAARARYTSYTDDELELMAKDLIRRDLASPAILGTSFSKPYRENKRDWSENEC